MISNAIHVISVTILLPNWILSESIWSKFLSLSTLTMLFDRREEIKEEVSIKKKNEERRKGLRDSLQKSKNLIDGHKKPSATEMTKR